MDLSIVQHLILRGQLRARKVAPSEVMAAYLARDRRR